MISKPLTAATIIRRHIGFTFDYTVSTLHFINSAYGTSMMIKVAKLLHRLNTAKGLTPRYHEFYTQWSRVSV